MVGSDALGESIGEVEVADLDLDATAAAIDRSLSSLRRGVISAAEAFAAIKGTTSLFLRFAVVPAAEVDLLIDYSRLAVEELALLPSVMDPVLMEVFDEWLHGERMVGELQARLDALLDPLLAEAEDGSSVGRAEIAELCRSGRRTHRMLLRVTGAAGQILRAAYTVGCAEGLRDAVSPEFYDWGQVARGQEDREEFVLAMNLLAQLAADPARGSGARSALIDLADHLEVAGEAIVRLPLHLLDDGDRARLLEVHERRADLMADGRFTSPVDVALLRDSRLVRGAVWQAFDARHVR